MERMIRKQVYIEPRQDRVLKERSRRYRVTEADLIRRALDKGLEGGTSAPNPEAWREIEKYIARRVKRGGAGPRGGRRRRRWTRDELYDR